MNRVKVLFFVFALFAMGSVCTWAAEDPESVASGRTAQGGPKVAVFSVLNLSTDLAKDLAKALGGEEGALSAKVDQKNGVFVVTFDPGKTSPEELQEVVARVAPEARLGKVTGTGADGKLGNCAKCPIRHECEKQRE